MYFNVTLSIRFLQLILYLILSSLVILVLVLKWSADSENLRIALIVTGKIFISFI